MCPRPLEPQDLRGGRKPTVVKSRCSACRSGAYVPQPGDVPLPLRNLKPEVLKALRPFEIDTGMYQRAQYGYRVHMAMISCAWAPFSVDAQIAALSKRRDRRAARAALQHLLSDPARQISHYHKFYDEHKKFLRKNGEAAPEKTRKRPLRWIEQEGIECSLWPHLYWKSSLCETVTRMAHEARRATQRQPASSQSTVVEDQSADEGSSEEEKEEQEQQEANADVDSVEEQYGRIKKHFLRKVFSPVIGYGGDYELLYFVYDLSMWTTVGTKKNVASAYSVPLRLVLKGCPWAPQYWRIRHQAVVDLQRQCGNATLFRTRAPYERTFPYHRWVMDEQEKLGRTRLHLSGPETFHTAHALLQLDKGFICGAKVTTDRPGRTWQNHLLGCSDGSGRQTVKNHVTRLEFQDGKRKLPSQSYHGKGTVHSHSLDFLQNIAAICLENKVSASIPPKETEPFMHGLVMDSQRDRKDSKLPVREEGSKWDDKLQKLLLHHSEDDNAENVRAYFPATMAVTKCHEDIQQGDGNGAVLHYVATYSTKFSSCLAA